MIRVAHYVNQFFGQIGGEDKAGLPPRVVEGPVGPGILLQGLLAGQGEVVVTLICGDNYFSENIEQAAAEFLGLLHDYDPDVLVAGPAFNAGRYGIACGAICKSAQERLGLISVTGMFSENPGADLYRRHVHIVETGGNAAGMAKAMPKMMDLVLKLFRGEAIGKPAEEGYLPQGIKKNVIVDKLASHRAIDMLLRRVRGEEFNTEVPLPVIDMVAPAEPITDLSRSIIALVTEGGLVPIRQSRSDRICEGNKIWPL